MKPKVKTNFNFLKSYSFSILLIISILIGAFIGTLLKQNSSFLKPFGDIFLNLLFTTIVPLVFFSIASAVAEMSDLRRLGKILGWMLLIFVLTGAVASLLMIVGVKIFPPVVHLSSPPPPMVPPSQTSAGNRIIQAFTVPDVVHLLSKQNMLALIVFSILIGLGASSSGEKGKPFVAFLISANEVMMKVISYIMLYAPIGLAAYFAYLTGVFGPELLGSYLRAMLLYYPLAIFYFLIGFSIYAFLAAGKNGVKTFWKYIIPPSLTAFGTGSSVATIPSNLEAADNIGIPKDISKIVIPIGATIHMDGSCLSAILKIAFLFSFFHMNFSGMQTLLTAVGVAILSGVVMSGIPGGGFLGELLIVTLYGFPPEALPMISMIGTLVDPPATMVNAVGDNVASMMVATILGGKRWMVKKEG